MMKVSSTNTSNNGESTMTRSIKQTVRGFILIGLGILVGHATSADADQKVAPQAPDQTAKVHKIKFPRVDPRVGGPCSQEASDYLYALDALAAAQDDADNAYYAWMECQNMGKSTKTAADHLELAPTNSVLVTD
jgi:hypothetical protein